MARNFLSSLGDDTGAATKTWMKWRDYWNNRVYDARKEDGDLMVAAVRKTMGAAVASPSVVDGERKDPAACGY